MKRYHFLFAFFILAVSCEKTNNINDKTTIENNYYDKAYDFLAKSEKDSAFIYFNLAKNIFSQNNDSVRVGNCLVNMAIIEGEKGDYFGSQETALSAIIYLDENELKLHPIIYSNYNNLGIVANNLKDFKNSLIWYDKALKISDNEQKQTIYNNIAMVNSRSDHYSKALNILKSLQANLNDSKNINSKTRILDNLAYTKFLQNKNYNAEPELNRALEIREIEKDLWGQNASHAHLSDYFEAKNTEKALFHAHKMYEIASRLKSPDDQIESLQKLVNLENSENSKRYFNIYLKLNDSLQTARNKAKNQFALVRYESEKNRADLLKSQAENTKKNYQLLVRNVALGLAFLSIIMVVIWLKKRQKRVMQEKELLHQENQLKIKNTELKYSKKVHDVFANGVYQIMTKVENEEDLNKEKLLNDLENLYEKSRDISYEASHKTFEKDYKTQIYNLLQSYSSDHSNVIIIGNDDEVWEKISSKIKTEIIFILQELLVNMKKHSQAKRTIIKFETFENQLHINYSDDGIGLSKQFQKKNGLQNTENRIFSCHGSINFDKTTEKGIKINISFPVK